MNGIEKSIARAVASAIIGAGHKISVDFERGYDTDEAHRDLTDLDKIIAAADEVDECWFMIDAERDGDGSKATAGFVYFIWGNGDEGRTCVSDYATSLEPLLESIWPWAEEAECQLVGSPASFKLRQDAKALDTGMDPELVRELHAEADRLEGGEISDWVLSQWAQMGLTHSVRLPDGHVIEYLSQETVDVYVAHRGGEQVQ